MPGQVGISIFASGYSYNLIKPSFVPLISPRQAMSTLTKVKEMSRTLEKLKPKAE